MEPQSVEAVCNLLAKSGMLTSAQVRGLFQRWRAAAGDPGDLAAFRPWLVAGGYVTEHQAGLVMRGKVDHFFFGPYKILERVGKGRMAGVYKAIHSLGQVVAIKVLPPSRAREPQILGRFQREARLAMQFKHPNVVRTYQAGENDGLHYIVMEYLDGETLEDALRRRGSLPPAEAVWLIHQALQGLQHIHERGMIHRDLKPGNLMLVGGSPASTHAATVKVMDIGLGKALFDEGEAAATEGKFELTNEGSLLGTLDYMAPEQARSVQTADIRSDVYSLGCTLYHALAGQVPFPDTSIIRLLMRHAREAPRPLSQLNPAVPDGLRQIVDWMMAKNPAKRYPTPERAAQALQVYLAAGEEPPAQPEPKMRVYLEWLDSQSGEVIPKKPANAIDVVPVAGAEPEVSSEAAPATAKSKVGPRNTRRKRPEAAMAREVEEDEEARAPGLLKRRDFLMFALGGIALVVGGLLVAGFGYAVHQLLRPKTDPEPPGPAPDESPP
jgi:eukaryotic-like serine/threonine-protein kinase